MKYQNGNHFANKIKIRKLDTVQGAQEEVYSHTVHESVNLL